MMPKFGKTSQDRLSTCHPDLQLICTEAIKLYDFSVICGYRGEAAQNEAYVNGYSGAKWGESYHNQIPSLAIDIVPYPSSWENKYEFYRLSGIIMTLADKHNIKIRWGGDFKGFFDGAHWELLA